MNARSKEQSTLGQAELVGVFKQDSPEWHEARAALIGGSDIASVLGLSDWKSAYTLWHEKAGLIAPAEVTAEQARKRAYGHHMEPFVASLFYQAHPELSGYETGTWRHAKRQWQGCNPDRLISLADRPPEQAHTLLQIKTANFADEDWAEEPPAGYLAQVRWEMDTFGFPEGWLAVYFNVGGGYREYRIEADPFDQEAVRAAAWKFADSITEGNPPDIDGSSSTYETLRKLNPSIRKGTEQHIPQDVAEAYLDSMARAKAATSEQNKWKGHLLAHMGTAQYAVYDGRKIASRVAVKDGVPYLKEA